MKFARQIGATFLFEFARSLTKSRISTSVVLVLFAPTMLVLIARSNLANTPTPQIPAPFFILSVFHLLAVFLTALLWATPVVFSELEGKTWTYLSIRPYGKLTSTLGKYLNAVFWSCLTASLSLALSCMVVAYYPWDVDLLASSGPSYPDELIDVLKHSSQPKVLFLSLFPCVILGSMALSAIYIHIGLITHKRGMVFAVIYGFIESGLSMLPAVVRQFTIGFHLRNIGIKSTGKIEDVPLLFQELFPPQIATNLVVDTYPMYVHLLIVVGITVLHLGASIYWLHSREYITAEEA